MSVVSMRKLLESGSHFGHQTRRWNPKMKPYIYTAKNSVYIIDLQKTIVKLDDAYAEMKAIGERGGKVLFVGTKKQAQTIVLDEALRSGSFFINQRWLGGLLTNFRTIQKSIRRLVEIEEMEANGTINVYPKKEIAQLRKEAARLENFLGGIKDMKKLPDAIFVVDPTEEHNAVAEARKLHIPVFGIIDTNCDPDVVDFGIPANDDAIRSVKLIVGLMADALVESKGGVLSFAYQNQDEENDITMSDVIINVEQQNEENERRRRQRMEERRSRDTRRPYQNRGPREFDRNRPRPEGRSDATSSTPYAKPPVTSASTANVESTQAVVKPETVTPVAPQVEVETKPVVKPQVETVEVETKPVVKPQVEVVEVETNPVVKPQVEVVEVKTKPVVKPQVEKVVDKAEVVVEKPVKKATTKKAKEVVEPVVEEGKEVLPKAPRKTTKKTVKTEEENND